MATNEKLSGRERERLLLAEALRSERSEFLALYGRRRVGKTFLVRSVFANQRSPYFELVGRFGGSTKEHLRLFAESLGLAFHQGARLEVPRNWHDAFQRLQEAVETRGTKRKVVLFFDELPWIASHRSGFLEELEHFWNAWCSRRRDVVLVVCGSAASWMLRKVVNARGGLHNRLTRSIRLLPFELGEVRAFFGDRGMRFTGRQLVELYMALGGVPHYLSQVRRGQSVPQTLDALYFARDAALAEEFERLFASLFEDDARYVRVVRALATKRSGLSRNELLVLSRLNTGGGATQILENLEQGGFIDVAIPFGRSARDRVLRLSDEFTLFHQNWLSSKKPASWQDVHGTPRWRAWAGLAFENVCLKHVAQIERALGISGVATNVTSWHHPSAQIDLIIDRADDVISVCEMKFSDAPFVITKAYASELRRKLDAFRRATGTRKAIQLVFVTSYGVADGLHARELVDAQVTMDLLAGV